MKSYLLIPGIFAIVLLSNTVVYADDFCDMQLNAATGLSDMDSPTKIEGGKLVVDKSSNRYISSGDQQARVKLSYYDREGKEVLIPTDIKLQETDTMLTLSRRAESAVTAGDHIGFESRFQKMGSTCMHIQNVAVFKDGPGDTKRVVFDRPYCDQVRGILAKQGDAATAEKNLGACADFLADIRDAYNKRELELKKEKLVMGDSFAQKPARGGKIGAEGQSGAEIVLGLMAFCAPQKWTQFSSSVVMPRIERSSKPAAQ